MRLCLVVILFSAPAILCGEVPSFEKEVLPILEQHCVRCHGPEKQKGDVRLDTLSTDLAADRGAAETWHDALDAIQLGEMPPEDEPQPGTEERRVVVEWIEKNLDLALERMAPESEGTVLRRLNREEYAYTMRDLLGFEMDYADDLPADPLSRDGFLNNGAALGMSAMQIDAYLETARNALEWVLVEGERPEREVMPTKPGMRDGNLIRKVGPHRNQLGRYHYWGGEMGKIPQTGPFTVRITARTDRTKGQPVPILGVDYGYFVKSGAFTAVSTEPLGEIDIDSNESMVYEIRGRAEFVPQPDLKALGDKPIGGGVTLRNVLDDGKQAEKPFRPESPEPEPDKKAKRQPVIYPEDPDFPKIIIEKVEVVANDYADWPPPAHRAIVPADADLESEAGASEVISRFLSRAWRRPVAEEDLARWVGHYTRLREEMGSPVAALREILSVALASDHFLFLAEPAAPENSTRSLDGYELASRLSYFLWSSMPDDRLFELAASGALLEPEVLAAEFDRMLADEKSGRFIKQFTDQWLDLGALDRVAINPQYYRRFDNNLKTDMVGETRAFFEEILRNDLSALLLLDADFTMATAALASHYGLEGPKSQRFERVSLAASGRPGGLLGHASTHMAGSDGAHSHPIKRAVWLRERLLHDPPKPPPPNVPDITDSVPDFEKLSVREQLEVHRNVAACADCHNGIDPWGIAFESYDAIGKKREMIPSTKKPADPNTVLPGNVSVGGLHDLQDYLVEKRVGQFSEALSAKLLIYALGRSLELPDEARVDHLAEDFAENGYRVKHLMKNIVLSEAFLNR